MILGRSGLMFFSLICFYSIYSKRRREFAFNGILFLTTQTDFLSERFTFFDKLTQEKALKLVN